MVVVDIGANIGFHTILLSKLVESNGKVYSFEPDKENFRFLKNNTKGRANISLNNLAVGNKNGLINFYLSRDLNVDHQSYDSGEGRKIVKVKCVSLDKFFNNIKSVDLIKIDIEGFDYYAILGSKKLIERQKKIALIGELWPYGLEKAGVTASEYINLLKSLGMKVKILNNIKTINKNKGKKYFYTNFIAYK